MQMIEVVFQERVEKQVVKGGERVANDFLKMLEKVQGMTLPQLSLDKGVNWEKVTDKKDKSKGLQLWSLRINRDWRAICVLHSGPVIEILAVLKHDRAYH